MLRGGGLSESPARYGRNARGSSPSTSVTLLESGHHIDADPDRKLPIVDGVANARIDAAIPSVYFHASVKHDTSAVAAVTWNEKAQQVRLVTHRIFQPTPDQPLDFEATIEAALLDLKKRFQVRKVLFDPYQMMASSQRLTKQGLPIEEFPQSPANLAAASQNLFDLIQGQNIVAYPDAAMRLAISRAIAVETPRGWRFAKEKQSHKIDVVVALAMACHAAVQGQSEPFFDTSYEWANGPRNPDGSDPGNWQALRTQLYLQSGGQFRLW